LTNITSVENVLSSLYNLKVWEVMSSEICLGSFRLDASFYSNAKNLKNYLQNASIDKFCEKVFNPPVFKREFQETKSNGCRYLASAEIVSLESDEVFIHDAQARKLDLMVQEGWVLVTGFGTIGSIRIVDNIINGFAVANNVARIVPRKPREMSGFIAAFLSSPLGNSILNDHASGSVVRFIEAPEIAKVPIPIIEDNLIKQINSMYWKAVKLREDAFDILVQAETCFYKATNLSQLSVESANWLDPARQIESAAISSSEVVHNNHSGSEYRLDAHFYNPLAQLAIKNIQQSGSQVKTIEDVTERVFMCNRFKRNYVNEQYGVPFLSGKNIIQIRPTDLKYISLSETSDVDDLKLQKGWTLITRSGTLGRTCFIWGNYEDYAATEDIIRVVPDDDLIDAGYVYAFLSSQYGYQQILRFRHGSVIDHITPEQVEKVLVPLPTESEQKEIGDLVRTAYDKRAEAIRLEDKAQKILMEALSQ